MDPNSPSRSHDRTGARSQQPTGAAASSPGRTPKPPKRPVAPGDKTPGWVAAIGIFLVVAVGGTLALSWFIVPGILRHASVEHLNGPVHTITELYLGLTGVAALLAGAVGAWQAGRAGQGFLPTRVFNGLLGSAVPIGGLIGYSYVRHVPIPSGPTKANVAIAILAAIVAGILVSLLHQASPRLDAPRPQRLSPAPRTMAIVLLASSGMGGLPFSTAHPPDHQLGTAKVVPIDGSNDIGKSDCVVSSTEYTAAASFTVFSLDLGPVFSYSQSTYADHSVQEEVTVGAKAGFKLSEGGHFLTQIGKLVGGVGLSVSVDTHAALTLASTYKVPTGQQADDITRWALGRYSVSELALPGLAPLGTSHMDKSPAVQNVNPPIKSELKLEGTLHFQADIGTVTHESADLEIGANAAVALEDDNNKNVAYVNDPTKVELAVGLSASGTGAAMVPLAGGVSANLNGEVVVSMELAKVLGGIWVPASVSADLTGGLSGSSDFTTAEADLGSDAGSTSARRAVTQTLADVKGATDLGGSSERGVSLQVEASVDHLQDHPEVLTAALGFIRAARDVSGSHPTSTQRDSYKIAGNTLATLLDHDGQVIVDLYEVTTGSLTLDVSWGEAITFGASASLGDTQSLLRAAMIRPPGGSLGLSQSCPGPMPATTQVAAAES